MGAGASVDQATASKHKAFSEEDWKKAGGAGGSLALVRVKLPKADAKAGISFTKTGEIAKVNPGGLADKAGCKAGWKVALVKGVETSSNAEINAALKDARGAGSGYEIVVVKPGGAKGKPAPAAKGKPAPATKGGKAAKGGNAAEAKAKAEAEAAAAAEAEAKAKADAEAAEAEAKQKAEAEAEAVRLALEKKKELGNGKVIMHYEMYDEEFDIVDGSTTAAAIDDLYCLSDVMPRCKIHISTISKTDKLDRKRQILDLQHTIQTDKEQKEADLQRIRKDPELGMGSEEERAAKEALDVALAAFKQSEAVAASGFDGFTYVEEKPKGTFLGLEKGKTYHVYVEENDEEFQKAREKQDKVSAIMNEDSAANSRAGLNFFTPGETFAQNRIVNDAAYMVPESCSCLYGNPCVDEYSCRDWTNRFAVAKANGWKGF